MSQHTVNRLKELLFERESRELDELAQRLEVFAATERRDLEAVNARLDEIAERAGGDEQLRRSVARVIDGSLADAEETRHRDLSKSLAPVIQRTFRSEIRSEETQTQLENALYPKLGVMVQRYIASAMRDMMNTINKRLESGLTQNRLVLKLRSIASGRSMAELALADTQQFKVEELYLIRRGSGELVHRWSRGAAPDSTVPSPRVGSNRDTLISGFLTAITGFAEEAFADDKSALRSLTLDNHAIYLRASPTYLLAAKCSGTAEAAVEATLDASLLDIISAHQDVEKAHAPDAGPGAREAASRAHEQLLQQSSHTLETKIASAEEEIRQSRGSMRPLKFMLATLAILAVIYAGWQIYIRTITSQLQMEADAIVRNTPGAAGYPLTVRVERGGRTIWVNGLVPAPEAREYVLGNLKQVAPTAEINAAIGVLPRTDVDAAVEARSLQQTMRQTKRRMERVNADMERASAPLEPAVQEAIASARKTVTDTAGSLDSTSGDRNALVTRLHDSIRKLSALHQRLLQFAGNTNSNSIAEPQLPQTVTDCLEELALAAERVGAAADLIEQSTRQARLITPLEQHNARLTRDVDELNRLLAGIKRSPRDALQAFTRERAIFFASSTDYRDAQTTRSTLDELARLTLSTDALIRVVGYTDEAGVAARNQTLSQQRADKVAEELTARGVPRNRLVAVGRSTTIDLAPRSGASSTNRRVEFEIGFVGEEAGTP